MISELFLIYATLCPVFTFFLLEVFSIRTSVRTLRRTTVKTVYRNG